MKTIKQKLFHQLINSLVNENSLPVQLSLTENQAKAFLQAVSETKKFSKLEGKSLNECLQNLEKKREASVRFKAEFGFDWPL